MRIDGLRKFRGRNPHGYFVDLPWEVRRRAQMWLYRFVTRRKARFGHVPRWLFAIYVGQAKRLARTSAEQRSAWGHYMLAKRGGYAVQRSYERAGRVGRRHPAHRAALISAGKRKVKKQHEEERSRRKLLGLPPKPRFKYLPIA